jgi:ABC-type phosphate transport system permease subunit
VLAFALDMVAGVGVVFGLYALTVLFLSLFAVAARLRDR